MIRGMTFFHGHENSAAGRANFAVCSKRSFNGRAIVGKIDKFCGEINGTVRRRWPQKFDRIFGRDRARRILGVRALHQVIRRRPVAVTIQKSADDPAVQNSWERFVFLFRFPFRNHFTVLGETADAQAFGVGRAASPACVVRRVRFLQ